MATFLARAFGLDDADSSPFTDVDPDSTHAASIDRVYGAGAAVACGTGPPVYCPSEPITYVDAAVMLYALLVAEQADEDDEQAQGSSARTDSTTPTQTQTQIRTTATTTTTTPTTTTTEPGPVVSSAPAHCHDDQCTGGDGRIFYHYAGGALHAHWHDGTNSGAYWAPAFTSPQTWVFAPYSHCDGC